MTYEYFISLDERGEFYADVRLPESYGGDTVFDIDVFEIVEDGFMQDSHDVDGLEEYLIQLGVIDRKDTIVLSN